MTKITKLSFILLVSILLISSCAPLQNNNLILKDGSRLDSIQGKMNPNSFVYRSDEGSQKKISYDSIEYIEQGHYYDNELLLYRSVQKEGSDKFFPLRVLVQGENIELYAAERSSGGQFGGIYYAYFGRKDKSIKLKYFGPYDTLTNNLGDKLKNYFQDCQLLIDKIESKEFRMRSDVEKMFEFYEQNCGK